jgi:hypothetical protein
MLRRTASGSLVMSCPFIVAVPLVGRSKVESMFSVVVLPAPFGPKKPKISPFFTVKLMPLTALTVPLYVFLRSVTSMALIR